MEAENNIKFCSLCSLPRSTHFIAFSCGHSLCFECFPFFLYNFIEEYGIQTEFFQNPKKEHSCQICQKGVAILPFSQLFDFYSKKMDKKPQSQPMCDACEKLPSKVSCLECNQNYCEQCGNFFHKANKKISQHKLLGFDQKSQFVKSQAFLCVCPSKRALEFFCLQCKNSICKYCAIVDHGGHEKILMEELQLGKQKCNFKEFRTFLDGILMNFTIFQKELLFSLGKEMEGSKLELNELLNEIASLLNKIKDKINQYSENDNDFLVNQLNLIKLYNIYC